MLALLYGDWLPCTEARSPCSRKVGQDDVLKYPDSPAPVRTYCAGETFLSPGTTKLVPQTPGEGAERGSHSLSPERYHASKSPRHSTRSTPPHPSLPDGYKSEEQRLLDGEPAQNVVSAFTTASSVRRSRAKESSSNGAQKDSAGTKGRERRRVRSGRSPGARGRMVGGRDRDWKAELLAMPDRSEMSQRSSQPRPSSLTSRVELEWSIRDEAEQMSASVHSAGHERLTTPVFEAMLSKQEHSWEFEFAEFAAVLYDDGMLSLYDDRATRITGVARSELMLWR